MTMNRLIDADELERAVMSLGEDVVCDDCAYEFVNLIDAQPTIEAEPVHWINMDEDEPPLGQKVLVYRAKKPVEIMSMLYMDNEYWWRNNAGLQPDSLCRCALRPLLLS